MAGRLSHAVQRINTYTAPSALSLHTFCGKECAQAALCSVKSLIRRGLRTLPLFLADASTPFGLLCAVPARQAASVLHIFCGQNCEEASCVASSSLFLKGKISLHKIVACVPTGQLTQAGRRGFLSTHPRRLLFAHKLWKTMCANAASTT